MSSENIDMINEMVGKGDTKLPPELEMVRNNAILAIGEVLCYGARVRPLLLGGEHLGYIRGLRMSERHWLSRMYVDGVKRIQGVVRAATTLSDDQINRLTSMEIRRLLKLVMLMSKQDYLLTAWAYPYSTTSASEKLWLARVKPPDLIKTPYGDMPTFGVSEVYMNWSYMAGTREDVKSSLKRTQDAVMIVRAQVGKGAASLSNEINAMMKELQVNSSRSWLDMGIQVTNVDFNDGWGHTFQDSSLDGLMREYHGMLSEDKHEQFIQSCMERQRAEILADQERIRNIQGRIEGITLEERIITPEEMRVIQDNRAAQMEEEAQARRAWVDQLDQAATGSRPWDFTT